MRDISTAGTVMKAILFNLVMLFFLSFVKLRVGSGECYLCGEKTDSYYD